MYYMSIPLSAGLLLDPEALVMDTEVTDKKWYITDSDSNVFYFPSSLILQGASRVKTRVQNTHI